MQARKSIVAAIEVPRSSPGISKGALLTYNYELNTVLEPSG
jgi:hypothetical protein